MLEKHFGNASKSSKFIYNGFSALYSRSWDECSRKLGKSRRKELIIAISKSQ